MFTALKKNVEEALSFRYYLSSIGDVVTKPVIIYVDNIGAVISSSCPERSLNKKTIYLSYHLTREYIANNVVEIRKMHTDENYAEPLTKAVNSKKHNDFLFEFYEISM